MDFLLYVYDASITLATRSKYHTCYLCLFASYTYKRNSIIVFRTPILVYLDVRGVEISLLSTVSISNCRYQEAPLRSARPGVRVFFTWVKSPFLSPQILVCLWSKKPSTAPLGKIGRPGTRRSSRRPQEEQCSPTREKVGSTEKSGCPQFLTREINIEKRAFQDGLKEI